MRLVGVVGGGWVGRAPLPLCSGGSLGLPTVGGPSGVGGCRAGGFVFPRPWWVRWLLLAVFGVFFVGLDGCGPGGECFVGSVLGSSVGTVCWGGGGVLVAGLLGVGVSLGGLWMLLGLRCVWGGGFGLLVSFFFFF